MITRLTLAAIIFLPGLMAGYCLQAQDELGVTLVQANGSLTGLTIALSARNQPGVDTGRINLIQRDIDRIGGLLSGLTSCIVRSDNIDSSLSSDLAREIRNYKELFDLVANTKDADSIVDILNFVKEDLNLKYDGSLASSTFASNEYVSVRVRVLDNTMHELPGYTPHVKPVWSTNHEQELQFNATTNAVKDLVPGKKLFWIEKNGIPIQHREEGIRINDPHSSPIDFVVSTAIDHK